VREVDGVVVMAGGDPADTLGMLVKVPQVVQPVDGPNRPHDVLLGFAAQASGSGFRVNRPGQRRHERSIRAVRYDRMAAAQSCSTATILAVHVDKVIVDPRRRWVHREACRAVDLLGEHLVGDRPLRWRPSAPRVEAGVRHLQQRR
jgi:hypothetical protein